MNNIIKKGVVVAVILLFIGLAFAPSINANVSKASLEDELVEFTTEVCGLNYGKHTVKLTKEEAEEVEALFDSIRDRLNATKSLEEAEEIFKEAVLLLDSHGLLPDGISVKKVQRLITRRIQSSKLMKLSDKIGIRRNENSNNVSSNILCLTFANRRIGSLSLEFLISWYIAYLLLEPGLLNLAKLILIYSLITPFRFMTPIIAIMTFENPYTHPFIFTVGLNGIQIANLQSYQAFIFLLFNGIKIKYNLIKYNFEFFDEIYIGVSYGTIGPLDYV